MPFDFQIDVLAALLLATAVVLLVLAWRRARLGEAERARFDEARAALETEATRRHALLRLHDRALAGGGLEAFARDAAQAVIDAMGVPHCAVLEATENGRLRVAASAGWTSALVEGLAIDAHVDSQVGYALVAREPVVVADADAEPRFAVPPELRTRGARSSLAVRIGAKQTSGVLVACGDTPRTFDDSSIQFACGVAATLAAAFERRRREDERVELVARDEMRREAAQQAARRATFLAQTATVLDAALDPDTTLVSLARLAVPAIADCAVVDRVDENGRLRRVEVVDIDPIRRHDAETLRRLMPDLRREGPFGRAVRTGQPVLLPETAKVITDAPADAQQLRFLARLGCQSLVLIPLVARGQTLGLLTLGSRLMQRYDGSDLALAQELAGRAAMALDNGRLHREAEEASRAKDEFLAIVSHELRTPLNAVLGWSALLRTQVADEGRTRQALDAIDRSVRAQARLVEELLDVSRIAAGTFELHLSSIRLQDVIEAAEDAVRSTANDRRIRIESRIDPSVPAVAGDPSRLEQVVVNLLSNAIQFSPADGCVEVELRRADDRTAELLVRDYGAGIGREFLPHVFERFRQSRSPNAAPNHGLGLGLSIVRDIVEKHGGAVTAESAGEGQGATFRVLLPFGAPAADTVDAGRVKATPAPAPAAAAAPAAMPTPAAVPVPPVPVFRVWTREEKEKERNA